MAPLLCLAIACNAQQFYFAYLQTENKQAFYVKINNKVLSSSNSGYLVIPKLISGTYSISVGFAQDKWPQQQFNLVINEVDEGFVLKNFGQKGWGLYNIQSMAIFMSGAAAPKMEATEGDFFDNKLQGATNVNVPAKLHSQPKSNPTLIKKIADVRNNYGLFMQYSITTANKVDTVDVNIEVAELTKIANNEIAQPKVVQENKTTAPIKEKFLDITMAEIKEAEKVVASKPIVTINNTTSNTPYIQNDKPIVNFNSDCKAFATEDDFYKTRKKIAMEASDDEMVEVAKKLFKQKCYSVAQVKNLSLIFVSDNGKYKLFDAAYAFTTDTQNFASLEEQLKDSYYINRFKAMLRN